MKTQRRTIHSEDACRANVRPQCCAVQANRKAVSAVPSEQGYRQGHGPFGGPPLLILALIASALARTN
jgi:hypothetical protein